MNFLFKITFIFIFISLIQGCSIPQYKLKMIDLSTGSQIKTIDSRKAESKTTETLSSIITNCQYGISRLGDSNLNFDRVSYFSSILANSKDNKYKGHTIDFKRFDIYKNKQSILRSSGNYTGLVIRTLQRFECHAAKDMVGGYDLDENPTGRNALILNLELVINSKNYKIREFTIVKDIGVVHSSRPDLWEEGLNSIIRKAVTSLINKVDSHSNT